MNPSVEKVKFDLFSGKKTDGSLLYGRLTGSATSFAGLDYYVIKFWMWKDATYYLVKTRTNDRQYTLFSHKIDEESGVRFQNPVGSGWISDDLKTHLEMKLSFPRQSIFMSLFPSN